MTNTLTGNFLNALDSKDFGDFSAHDLVRHLPAIFETAGDLQAIVRQTTRNAGRTSLLAFEAAKFDHTWFLKSLEVLGVRDLQGGCAVYELQSSCPRKDGFIRMWRIASHFSYVDRHFSRPKLTWPIEARSENVAITTSELADYEVKRLMGPFRSGTFDRDYGVAGEDGSFTPGMAVLLEDADAGVIRLWSFIKYYGK